MTIQLEQIGKHRSPQFKDMQSSILVNNSNLIKLATVNYNALGTWLEPWIGWDFQVSRETKSLVYFYYQASDLVIESHNKEMFDIVLVKGLKNNI